MTTHTNSTIKTAVGREMWITSLATLIAALPTRIKVVIGLAVVVATLYAAGIPLTTFVPYAGLAACLGMHFFMGHGHHDGHSASDVRRAEPDQGSSPIESPRVDG
jgi:cell division protein FtsW (lipid II flippase)